MEVTLEVYKMATLPVSVSFINAPRNFDPSVLVYSLSKQTLNVAGPESQIEKLSTLSVGTIDLSTFALNKVYELPIELPGNIRRWTTFPASRSASTAPSSRPRP